MKFAALLSLFLLSPSLWAAPFQNVQGVYEIQACENHSATPSLEDRTLCEYTHVIIHPKSFATAIYFTKNVDGQELVRGFGVPATTRSLPRAKYVEKGDDYASYTNDDGGTGEVFIVRKQCADHYHFSLHRRTVRSRTLDIFEVEMKKISDNPETPPLDDGMDEPGDPCGEPVYD